MKSQTEADARPVVARTSPFAEMVWHRPVVLGWMLAALGAIFYLFLGVDFNPLEACLFVLGLTGLWLPVGGTCYRLLRDEIPGRLDRFTFSALASYSLTTLLYFGCAVLHVASLFYAGQLGLLVWVFSRFAREKPWQVRAATAAEFGRDAMGPMLALIIACSLLTCIKYNVYLHRMPHGEKLLATYHDNTVFAGEAYELSRHVPPLQSTIRAGEPERAYHMFPHLTTALIGRYTGQADLMRANLIYRNTILEVFICLSLFCLVRSLTGSAAAGQIAAALIFVFAIPFPPLTPTNLGYFYFTLYPHVSSLLEPIIVTTTQTVSAIPLTYAICFGLLQIARTARSGRRTRVLPILLALMVAAEMRFRLHVFLPLFPCFLVLIASFWWKWRRPVFVVAALVVIAAVALLFLEMRSSVYLRSSSRLLIGYNRLSLSVNWMSDWPFSLAIRDWLHDRLGSGSLYQWTWQVVCLTTFGALNICGLPMLAALADFLRRREAWRDLLPYTFMTLGLMVGSLVGGMILTTTYDTYSVGGQLPWHISIYGFPVFCVGVWRLCRWLAKRISMRRQVAVCVGSAAVIAATAAQFFSPKTFIQQCNYELDEVRLTPAMQNALKFLHDKTPPDSVVASNKVFNPAVAVYSGIGGRACYAEYFNGVRVEALPGVLSERERWATVNAIWNASSITQLHSLLASTPINYLIEFSSSPMKAHPSECLRKVWSGADPDGSSVTVWQVLRANGWRI